MELQDSKRFYRCTKHIIVEHAQTINCVYLKVVFTPQIGTVEEGIQKNPIREFLVTLEHKNVPVQTKSPFRLIPCLLLARNLAGFPEKGV